MNSWSCSTSFSSFSSPVSRLLLFSSSTAEASGSPVKWIMAPHFSSSHMKITTPFSGAVERVEGGGGGVSGWHSKSEDVTHAPRCNYCEFNLNSLKRCCSALKYYPREQVLALLLLLLLHLLPFLSFAVFRQMTVMSLRAVLVLNKKIMREEGGGRVVCQLPTGAIQLSVL